MSKKSSLNSYISELLTQTDGMSSYEAENYVIDGIEGIAPKTASPAVIRSLVQNVKRNLNPRTMNSNNHVTLDAPSGQLAAEFNIKMTRDTATLAITLKVPIFGHLESFSGFQTLLREYNPTVTSFVVKVGHYDNAALPDKLTIAYTIGGNTDTVTVECEDYPYVGILAALATKKLYLDGIHYEISDVTRVLQFKSRFVIEERTMFGSSNKNTIPVYKKADQFQDGIVHVDVQKEIKAETTFTFGILPVAAFSVNLGMFLSDFRG